jgi:8-oxo-dGTP pyrophosphatase MutT (NUDIX family)
MRVSEIASRNKSFIYRVAGVCVHEGHVLLHREESGDFWALPGGRPELFETSAAALEREMREEIGVDVEVGRLLWVMEHFFVHAGQRFHEIALYYEMRLPASFPYLDVRHEFTGTEAGTALIFRWFPIARLTTFRVYPSVLRTAIANLPASPQHLVLVETDDDDSAYSS